MKYDMWLVPSRVAGGAVPVARATKNVANAGLS